MTMSADDETGSGSSVGAIFLALAVVVGSILFLFYMRDGSGSSSEAIAAGTTKQKVDGIVLVGPSGSGKTTILHKLSSGVAVETVPSMVASYNLVPVPGSDKTVQVVDFPGHERLQASMLQHVKGAKGVAFVLDSSATKAIKQAALLLFQLLVSNELQLNTPLLVLCNKQDQQEAKNSNRVKMLLQKEIDDMRKTSGTMTTAGGEGGEAGSDRAAILGPVGKSFKFDEWAERSVTFASSSAVSEDGLAALAEFIAAC